MMLSHPSDCYKHYKSQRYCLCRIILSYHLSTTAATYILSCGISIHIVKMQSWHLLLLTAFAVYGLASSTYRSGQLSLVVS